MDRYELVIVWETGEKDIHPYSTRERAEEAEAGFKKAFGKQIEYICVREKK